MKKTLMLMTLIGGYLAGAQAGEVYGGIGSHGIMLGYAQPLNERFTVRADFATLGSHHTQTSEEGMDYNANFKFNRAGVFADWFFVENGYRLTGGATFNNFLTELVAQGNGSTFTVGSNTFTSASDDRLYISIEFPKTTPYLGIGYGHHQSDKGFGFTVDIGASIGRATVRESHSGTNLGNPSLVSQADIDAELAEIRDGVGKIRAFPLLNIGINYRF